MNQLTLNPTFIDTSIFYQNCFDFSSTQFRQLTELSNNHLIRIIISEITEREVIRNISELSFQAEESFRKYSRKNKLVRIYSGDTFIEVEKNFSSDNIKKKCISNFEQWINDANVEIIPIMYSNPSEVFELYFYEDGPFKFKKNEFPDAFSLSIICSKYENLFCISKDKDFLNCSHPKIKKHFNSLNSFIDYILSSSNSLHELIIREYNKSRELILSKIRESFPSLNFIHMDGWFTDTVKVTNIGIFEEKIIEISDGSATINLSANIKYEVMVYYKNIEDYKLEEDSHFMEIEVIFKYSINSFTNDFYYINIDSIKPKTFEDGIVLIHEEDFY